MVKPNWGLAIQLIANIGVILSIVFLAVQVRQGNKLLDLELRQNSLDRVSGAIELILENPYLLELLQKDPDELAPAERDALVLLGSRSLSNFQNAFEDMQRGLRDEASLIRTVGATWARPRLNYAMPLAWPTFRERGDPEFVRWMERNIIDDD